MGDEDNSEEVRMEYEQKGYDAWNELFKSLNRHPTATDCPARWMAPTPKRFAYIRGWNNARREHDARTTFKDIV